MANDQKEAARPGTAARSAATNVEQLGQKATEAGSRIGQAGAAAGAQIGQAAAQAGAEFSRNAQNQASAMGNEFVKMFADLRMPGLPDMQGLMDAHRRNLETIAAAYRVATEGAQAVTRRQMEIMQQSMQDVGETMRQLASTEAPQAKAARQAELLKASYEKAIGNMRELRDLMQRSNGEAVELINRRFVESMDEVRALMDKTQAHARPV